MFITAVSIVSLLFAEGTHVAGRTGGLMLEKLDLMQAMGNLEVSPALEGSGRLGGGEIHENGWVVGPAIEAGLKERVGLVEAFFAREQ